MSTLSETSIYTFEEASGYLKILHNSLVRKSKFDNFLLYNIVSLCTEKLLVSLLAHHKINATHHTPMALFREAQKIETLPASFLDTIRLVSKFESICLMDAFGYKEPTPEELRKMIEGLTDIENYVQKRVGSKCEDI
jgi:hypothetical protein